MNFLALGARTLKAAKKARLECAAQIQIMKDHGVEYTGPTPEEAYENIIEQQFKDMEEAANIGLTYYNMLKRKLGKDNDNTRHYMLTVRPPHNTNFETLKFSTESFVKKWESHWDNWEYAYEQKGETEDTLGYGCHVHIIISTTTPNYYPSHILKHAKSTWSYVAANCIQVDTLQNIPKAKEYIRGIKSDESKKQACVMDIKWREKNGIQQLYEKSGQVQPALL